jgi:hypothetical protein
VGITPQADALGQEWNGARPAFAGVGVPTLPRLRLTTAEWRVARSSTRCYPERRNGSPRRVTTTSAAPITNATTPAAAGLIPLPPVAGSAPAGWLVTVAANTTAAEVEPVDVVTGAGVDVEDDGTVAGVVVTASGGEPVDVVVGAVAHVSIVMKGPPTRPRLSPLEVKTAVMSIWPPQFSAASDSVAGPVEPTGITPDTSAADGPELIPSCQRTRIGVSPARGASKVYVTVATPAAVTSNTTVNAVPSITLVFVQVRGAVCAVWLPPQSGSAASAAGARSADATETVNTATALDVSTRRTRLRARRSKK